MRRIIQLLVLAAATGVQAKMDLATIPTRDTVQLTIYNSADMTLVREQRALTLKEGINKLQFSWANTLIDPTSLEMQPKANADKIDILDLVYPPRVQNLGLWNVDSRVSGKSPVEISYLTSGLSWRAFYMGTLTPDETKLRLQGYVRVTNNSGEDYENAQTRLIVGKVHMLDQIAELARQEHPYGTPRPERVAYDRPTTSRMKVAKGVVMAMEDSVDYFGMAEPKEIKKEGLSEYFLYTIDGTETIPTGWSKRLPSFDTDAIPVANLYKFEEERYGSHVRRFLSFKNDEEHALGETPIPGGSMRVFRLTGEAAHLAFEGQSSFKYIPIDEKVELDLGRVENVIVEPKRMKQATANHRFDRKGNVSGWDEIHDFEVEVRNTRPVPVKVEIKCNLGSTYWKIEKAGDFGTFEKDDADTVKFTLELPPESKKTFTYQLTTNHGDNQQ
ncbi:DUF4139 domain-containing protein [Pontiella sp.]|uniref:DUF4139 domain-containing protein n=1 Tax=Pontiella sp. TaxID=2837462 RepID=UPI00356AA976